MKNYKLPIAIAASLLALILVVSSLDSDRETLSKVRMEIAVNQIGYLPQRHKTALSIDSEQPDTEIWLVDSDTKKPVATFLGTAVKSATREKLREIDFTDFTEPGTYFLQQGKLKSASFKIGADIYQKPLVTLLRSYYLQRCGVELDDPVTGITHAPCHRKDGYIAHQDEFHPKGEYISALGGWHNGAAYGKYVATTTVTIARLLELDRQYPQLFPDAQLKIPESNNNVSDLLDEMKFSLDWLLNMQREDGAVYRKLSGKKWSVFVAPAGDIQARYIYGISTSETAKFAAVMAIASRNFETVDPAIARRYFEAAELAWQYLQGQPEMQVDLVKGDNSGSLEFLADDSVSLQTDLGDRVWAAVELYLATGRTELAEYFTTNLDRVEYDTFGWQNPAPMAMTDYLRQELQPTSPEAIAKIEAKIKQRADALLEKARQSPYHLANDRFIEGSNRLTAEAGITLFYAYQLWQNEDYLNAAVDQLDYLLGRNYFGQTFITEVGERGVKNINHPFAIAKKIAIPGLVVGGPNSETRDGMVAQNRGQLSYIDDARSFNTNQYAIDNNAAVISLITYLTASL